MASELVLAARTIVPNPPLPPVTEAIVAEAEARLGFALPRLLRELYLHVGDGRFGPGYGLLSLNEIGDGDPCLADHYLELSRDNSHEPSWKWPHGVLPFCDWGCAIFSCVHCLEPPNPVLTFEYVSESVEASFMPTQDSFESWLRAWLTGGVTFEPVYEHAPEFDRVGRNPATGEPLVLKGRKPRRR